MTSNDNAPFLQLIKGSRVINPLCKKVVNELKIKPIFSVMLYLKQDVVPKVLVCLY